MNREPILIPTPFFPVEVGQHAVVHHAANSTGQSLAESYGKAFQRHLSPEPRRSRVRRLIDLLLRRAKRRRPAGTFKLIAPPPMPAATRLANTARTETFSTADNVTKSMRANARRVAPTGPGRTYVAKEPA